MHGNLIKIYTAFWRLGGKMRRFNQKGFSLIELSVVVALLGGISAAPVMLPLMSHYVVEPLTFVGPNATAIKDAEVLKIENALNSKCLVDSNLKSIVQSEVYVYDQILPQIELLQTYNSNPALQAQIIQTSCSKSIFAQTTAGVTNVHYYLQDKLQACDSSVLSAAGFDACRAKARQDGRSVINVTYKLLNQTPTYVSSGLVACNSNIYKCN